MKALSIKQPYAQWILEGRKTLEVRTWPTKYRGPLIVHAAQRDAMRGLPRPMYNQWLRGALIGVVDLIDCRPMRASDRGAACTPDFDPAFYVFELTNPRSLFEPVRLRGTTFLFDVSPAVIEHVKRHS